MAPHSTLGWFKKAFRFVKPCPKHPIRPTTIFSFGELRACKIVGKVPTAAVARADVLINLLLSEIIP
jgi:hypothetical protein